MRKKKIKTIQDRGANFRYKGMLYLVRCYSCGGKYGRENYAPSVATGRCCWCGWEEGKIPMDKPIKEKK